MAGLADELEKLRSLHQSGALTDDEFSAAKSRLLANDPTTDVGGSPESDVEAAPSATEEPTEPSPASVAPRTPEPRSQDTSTSAFLDPKANLRSLIGLIVLVAVLYGGYQLYRYVNAPRAPRGGADIAADLASIVREPQVVVDEEWVVDAGGVRWVEVTLPSRREALFEVDGRSHSSKGFSVYRVSGSEIDNVRNRRDFRHDPAFHGKKVRRFKAREYAPRGRTAFVVANSENLLRSMSVRVKVVIDPE